MVSTLSWVLALSACNMLSAFHFNGRCSRGQLAGKSTIQMKLFDWKRRGENGSFEPGELNLSNLVSAPGSRKARIRKGRGISSGKGKTCGFGERGQKSRSGRSVRPGFEGGQTPLYRRLPKFAGRPVGPGHRRKEYALIKTNHLNQLEDNAEVDFEVLLGAKIVHKQKLDHFKVVGGDELTVKGLTVKAHAFTKGAQASIEANGGTCVTLSRTTNKPIVAATSEEE